MHTYCVLDSGNADCQSVGKKRRKKKKRKENQPPRRKIQQSISLRFSLSAIAEFANKC